MSLSKAKQVVISSRIAKFCTSGLIALLSLSCSTAENTTINSTNTRFESAIPAPEKGRHSVSLTTRRSWMISEQASVLVLPPDNPTLFPRRAMQIQRQLQAALANNFARVDVLAEPANRADSPLSPRSYHYWIEAKLLVIEDNKSSLAELVARDSAGGMGRDRVSVKLRLFDAVSGELIDVTLVDASSRLPAFATGSTENLLNSAFQRYAHKLSTLGSYHAH